MRLVWEVVSNSVIYFQHMGYLYITGWHYHLNNRDRYRTVILQVGNIPAERGRQSNSGNPADDEGTKSEKHKTSYRRLDRKVHKLWNKYFFDEILQHDF